MPLDINTLNRLLELGAAATVPIQDGERSFAVIPDGCKVANLSGFYAPHHIQAAPAFTDAESFARYVTAFKTEETQIFVAAQGIATRFVAIMDYHGQAPGLRPCYAAHRAAFECQPTEEWRNWFAGDRRRFQQEEFAEHIELHVRFFEAPAGAELLELVENLHGHVEARFTQVIRRQGGGVKLGYEEDISIRGNVSAKQGEMELPAQIVVGLAPFQGATKRNVVARLKARPEGRKLTIWYETIDRAAHFQAAVADAVATVAAGTGITPLMGSPDPLGTA